MRQGPRTLNIYHQVKFLPKPERNCMGPHMQMATQNRREKKKERKKGKEERQKAKLWIISRIVSVSSHGDRPKT